jgi:hypothetical protein
LREILRWYALGGSKMSRQAAEAQKMRAELNRLDTWRSRENQCNNDIRATSLPDSSPVKRGKTQLDISWNRKSASQPDDV